jgi:amino acid permease
MDDGYQYFKKITKNPHNANVKFWWMDEKWCQHDIMIVVIGELHSSWKGVVTKLQMSCNELQWVAPYIGWIATLVTFVICLITLIAYKYDELQVFNVSEKMSCKANCKTPFFLIMYVDKGD